MSEIKCHVTHPEKLGKKNDDEKSILLYMNNPIFHKSVVHGVVCPVFFSEYEDEYLDGLMENNIFTILSSPGSGKTTFPRFFCLKRNLKYTFMSASELYNLGFGSSSEKMKIEDIQRKIEDSLMRKVLNSLNVKQDDFTSITSISEALKEVFGESGFCVHVDELQKFMVKSDFERKREQEEAVSPREYFIILLCEVLKTFSDSKEHHSFVFLTGTDVAFDQKIRLASDVKTQNIRLTKCTQETVSSILNYFLRLENEELGQCCERLCGCYRSVVYFVDSFYEKPHEEYKYHLESAYRRWEKDVSSIFSSIVNQELVLDKLLIARSMCFDIEKSVLNFSRTEVKECFKQREFEEGANSGAVEIESHGSDYQVSLSPYPFLLSFWYEFSSFDFSWSVLEQLAYSQHLDPEKRKGNVFQRLCAVDLMKNNSKLREVIEKKITENNPEIKRIRWNGEKKIEFDYFSSNEDFKTNGEGTNTHIVREVLESSTKKDGDIQMKCAIDLFVGEDEDVTEGVSLILECKYARNVDYVRGGFTKFFKGCKERKERKEFYIFINPFNFFYKNDCPGKKNMENVLSEKQNFNGHSFQSNVVVGEKDFENQEFLFDFNSVIEKLGNPDTCKKVLEVVHKKRNEMDRLRYAKEKSNTKKKFKVKSRIKTVDGTVILKKDSKLEGSDLLELFFYKCSGKASPKKTEMKDEDEEEDGENPQNVTPPWLKYIIYNESLTEMFCSVEELWVLASDSTLYFLTDDERKEEEEVKKLEDKDGVPIKVRVFYVTDEKELVHTPVDLRVNGSKNTIKKMNYEDSKKNVLRWRRIPHRKKNHNSDELSFYEYTTVDREMSDNWKGKVVNDDIRDVEDYEDFEGEFSEFLAGKFCFLLSKEEKEFINKHYNDTEEQGGMEAGIDINKLKEFRAGSGMSFLDKWFDDDDEKKGSGAISVDKMKDEDSDWKKEILLECCDGGSLRKNMDELLQKSRFFRKMMSFSGKEAREAREDGKIKLEFLTRLELEYYLKVIFDVEEDNDVGGSDNNRIRLLLRLLEFGMRYQERKLAERVVCELETVIFPDLVSCGVFDLRLMELGHLVHGRLPNGLLEELLDRLCSQHHQGLVQSKLMRYVEYSSQVMEKAHMFLEEGGKDMLDEDSIQVDYGVGEVVSGNGDVLDQCFVGEFGGRLMVWNEGGDCSSSFVGCLKDSTLEHTLIKTKRRREEEYYCVGEGKVRKLMTN